MRKKSVALLMAAFMVFSGMESPAMLVKAEEFSDAGVETVISEEETTAGGLTNAEESEDTAFADSFGDEISAETETTEAVFDDVEELDTESLTATEEMPSEESTAEETIGEENLSSEPSDGELDADDTMSEEIFEAAEEETTTDVQEEALAVTEEIEDAFQDSAETDMAMSDGSDGGVGSVTVSNPVTGFLEGYVTPMIRLNITYYDAEEDDGEDEDDEYYEDDEDDDDDGYYEEYGDKFEVFISNWGKTDSEHYDLQFNTEILQNGTVVDSASLAPGEYTVRISADFALLGETENWSYEYSITVYSIEGYNCFTLTENKEDEETVDYQKIISTREDIGNVFYLFTPSVAGDYKFYLDSWSVNNFSVYTCENGSLNLVNNYTVNNDYMIVNLEANENYYICFHCTSEYAGEMVESYPTIYLQKKITKVELVSSSGVLSTYFAKAEAIEFSKITLKISYSDGTSQESSMYGTTSSYSGEACYIQGKRNICYKIVGKGEEDSEKTYAVSGDITSPRVYLDAGDYTLQFYLYGEDSTLDDLDMDFTVVGLADSARETLAVKEHTGDDSAAAEEITLKKSEGRFLYQFTASDYGEYQFQFNDYVRNLRVCDSDGNAMTVEGSDYSEDGRAVKAAVMTLSAGTYYLYGKEYSDNETITVSATQEHKWETIIDKAATCESAGSKRNVCTVCKEEETIEIPATGHSWDEGTVTRKATDSWEGEITFHCTNEGCTGTKTERIAVEGEVAYGTCGDKMTWLLKGTEADGYTLYINGSGKMDFDGCEEAPWSNYTEYIENVVLATGIESVEDAAFEYCTSLTTVTISEGVTSIGNWAFDECSSLTTIKIPESMTSIGRGAFYACGLTTVTIPESVTSIGEYAFAYCESLTAITIPESVTSIGEDAFKACDSLKGIYGVVGSYAQTYAKEYGIPFNPCETHSWDAGAVTVAATCKTEGVRTYTCTVCGATKTESIAVGGHTPGAAATCAAAQTCTVCGTVLAKETAHTPGAEATCTTAQTCTVCGTVLTNATGHSFGAWTTTSAATVFAAEQQARTCTKCGAQETRSNGTKLTATISVNVKGTLPLKTKQKLKKVKVTGLANGDSVVSWKTSNPKIVKVSGKSDGTCTITAQKKTGKATITITLASGLTKKIKVKVQKAKVTTKSITVASTKLTLKKGKSQTLSVTLSPLSSTDSITYKSSNKKVATVSSKGVIKAKKKGTATITIKAGKKTKKIKVTVK